MRDSQPSHEPLRQRRAMQNMTITITATIRSIHVKAHN